VANCFELQKCVDGHSCDQNRAFAQYVNASPSIINHTDPFQCGRAREYFGFQNNFINDEQICEDISQLALTRDFEILNEASILGALNILKGACVGIGESQSDRQQSEAWIYTKMINYWLATIYY
jgi:hypothetical protein